MPGWLLKLIQFLISLLPEIIKGSSKSKDCCPKEEKK